MASGHEHFSREEIRELTQASDARGLIALAFDWAVIAGCFALAAAVPHPLVFVAVVVVLGGRQLALAVLMHEASHRSLFRTPWLNHVLGHWLCGAPIWTDLHRYRKHHLHHHAHTGTERDPDLCLIDPFPTSPTSLARKLGRDLVGWTGLRRIVGLLAMDFDVLRYSASGQVLRPPAPPALGARLRNGARRLAPVMLSNLAILGALWAVGHAWLYLLWLAAWMTTFSLFVRIRSIAEHACTERTPDPLRNTRSIEASLLARAFVAPHGVGYHLEHHMVPTVPFHRLRAMRDLLRERGKLEGTPSATSYLDVLREAASGR